MYELLCQHMAEGFCVLEILFDAQGKPHDFLYRDVNAAFESQAHLAGAKGRRMSELLGGREPPRLDLYADVARTGITAKFEQRSERVNRWYDVEAFRCGAPGENLVGVLFSDITQRKLDELMAKSVVEYAIILLDPDGRVQTWNAGAERIKGYAREEILGRGFSVFYTPEDVAQGRPAQVLAHAREAGHFEEEAWRVRRDGSRFWASVAVSPLRDSEGQLQGYVKVTHDLTERKRDEEAKERLRQLSTRLIDVQEQERSHVARHMHDDLGQILSVLRMHLADMTRRPDAATAQQCAKLVDQAIERARELASDMRPTILDDLGLDDALQWVLGEQASQAHWSTKYEGGVGERRFAGEVETACFRIAQEALANAARHARASEVSVALNIQGGNLVLVVSDNGRGFDAAKLQAPQERWKHIGLVAMQERAALVGARVTIESAPHRGTRVTAAFPLAR